MKDEETSIFQKRMNNRSAQVNVTHSSNKVRPALFSAVERVPRIQRLNGIATTNRCTADIEAQCEEKTRSEQDGIAHTRAI